MMNQKEYSRRWYLEHREITRARSKKRYEENRSKILQQNKDWRKSHPKESKAKSHKAYLKNRKKILEKQRKTRKKFTQEYNKKRNLRYKFLTKTDPIFRLKAIARRKTSCAIRSGKLIKQPCSICGSSKRIEAHHPDYSKPIEIKWLCKDCHAEVHSKYK